MEDAAARAIAAIDAVKLVDAQSPSAPGRTLQRSMSSIQQRAQQLQKLEDLLVQGANLEAMPSVMVGGGQGDRGAHADQRARLQA